MLLREGIRRVNFRLSFVAAVYIVVRCDGPKEMERGRSLGKAARRRVRAGARLTREVYTVETRTRHIRQRAF